MLPLLFVPASRHDDSSKEPYRVLPYPPAVTGGPVTTYISSAVPLQSHLLSAPCTPLSACWKRNNVSGGFSVMRSADILSFSSGFRINKAYTSCFHYKKRIIFFLFCKPCFPGFMGKIILLPCCKSDKKMIDKSIILCYINISNNYYY